MTSVSISDQPLSVSGVLHAVTRSDVGGSVVFVGTVRDHDTGREVAGLTYSAHPSALDLMQRVVDEIGAEFPRLTWRPRIGSASSASVTSLSSWRPVLPTATTPSGPPAR